VLKTRTGGAPNARRLLPLILVLALVLAGCTPPRHQAPVTPPPPPVVPEGIAEELVGFYSQVPEWTECGDLQCAQVRVPIDWDDPDAGEISLQIARDQAEGERRGTLFVNPGGPGGSGVDLAEQASSLFGDAVLEAYDVVGFDPRGVGASHPVQCLDPADKDALFARDFDHDDDAGLAEAFDAWDDFGASCAARTGSLLGHVGTVSAAKDLDVLRAVLGDETLTYLGYSYGTKLGATYAALFPGNVGRLVLDGAVDPTLTARELNLGQAEGFERALRNYVDYCQTQSDCPLTGSVDDGLAQIHALSERARRTPLPTGDPVRDLTATLLFYGIAVTLYDNRSWSFLTDALREAILEGSAATFLYLADFYFDRAPDGSYLSNQTEAFFAVNCADGRGSSEPDQMRAEAAELVEVAPTLGAAFGFAELPCVRWPVPPQDLPDDFSAPGAAPIVVIGTTNDPATPYAWSQNLAKLLDSGVLVSFEGEGHTAYGRSNACIDDAVDAFLVDGTVPQDGLTC